MDIACVCTHVLSSHKFEIKIEEKAHPKGKKTKNIKVCLEGFPFSPKEQQRVWLGKA